MVERELFSNKNTKHAVKNHPTAWMTNWMAFFFCICASKSNYNYNNSNNNNRKKNNNSDHDNLFSGYFQDKECIFFFFFFFFFLLKLN